MRLVIFMVTQSHLKGDDELDPSEHHDKFGTHLFAEAVCSANT